MARFALLRAAIRQREALAGKRLRVSKRRTRPTHPTNIARDYLAAILPILARTHALVQARLLPELANLLARARTDSVRTDGYVDALAAIMDGLKQGASNSANSRDVQHMAELYARRTEMHNSRETSQQIKKLTGIDVVGTVPGLEDKIQTFARQNVQLITTLPEDYLHDVEQTTLRAFREGKRAEEIAGMLEDRYGVSQSNAARIARDQIGKLNGELSRDRQQALGITRYVWRTSEDERVRPSHQMLDNQTFSWDDPPAEGNPGQAIQCRCWADPVVEDLIEE